MTWTNEHRQNEAPLAVLDMSEGLPELKLALLEVICERFPPDTTMVDTLELWR